MEYLMDKKPVEKQDISLFVSMGKENGLRDITKVNKTSFYILPLLVYYEAVGKYDVNPGLDCLQEDPNIFFLNKLLEQGETDCKYRLTNNLKSFDYKLDLTIDTIEIQHYLKSVEGVVANPFFATNYWTTLVEPRILRTRVTYALFDKENKLIIKNKIAVSREMINLKIHDFVFYYDITTFTSEQIGLCIKESINQLILELNQLHLLPVSASSFIDEPDKHSHD
jgi:hypothetical protein